MLNRMLRQRLAPGAGLLLPGAANALAARVIAASGFDAVYVTGGGIANSYRGVPDLGLVTLTELADHVAAMRDVVPLPLVVDADTGFGNALNVLHTVRALERAGANAVQIEDQIFPKRCGHFAGQQVIPAGEMVQKIKAATDARLDDGLVIVARTDARAAEGLDAALDRAALYREAGADVLFVEAPTSEAELARVAAAAGAGAPHLANMVFGGRTPLLPRARLAELGFAGILYANAALQAAIAGMGAVLGHLAHRGDLAGIEDRLASFEMRQQLVDHDKYRRLERRYATGGPDEGNGGENEEKAGSR
jgi:2-methylisocitrate lyase-like PEP mutase family enzyme